MYALEKRYIVLDKLYRCFILCCLNSAGQRRMGEKESTKIVVAVISGGNIEEKRFLDLLASEADCLKSETK